MGKVEADFLSGPKPTGRLLWPSLELAREKVRFASSRRGALVLALAPGASRGHSRYSMGSACTNAMTSLPAEDPGDLGAGPGGPLRGTFIQIMPLT